MEYTLIGYALDCTKTKYTSGFSGSTACHWGSTLKRKTFKLIYPQNCTLVPLSSNMPSTMNIFRVNKVQRCSFKGVSDKLLPKGTIYKSDHISSGAVNII